MHTASDVSPADLSAALRRHAHGTPAAEAALNMLEVSGGWLDRSSFREFVDYEDDPEIVGDDGPIARVWWASAVLALDEGKLRASSSEAQILRLAASLGGGVPVDLRECTRGFGSATSLQVAETLQQALR